VAERGGPTSPERTQGKQRVVERCARREANEAGPRFRRFVGTTASAIKKARGKSTGLSALVKKTNVVNALQQYEKESWKCLVRIGMKDDKKTKIFDFPLRIGGGLRLLFNCSAEI